MQHQFSIQTPPSQADALSVVNMGIMQGIVELTSNKYNVSIVEGKVT